MDPFSLIEETTNDAKAHFELQPHYLLKFLLNTECNLTLTPFAPCETIDSENLNNQEEGTAKPVSKRPPDWKRLSTLIKKSNRVLSSYADTEESLTKVKNIENSFGNLQTTLVNNEDRHLKITYAIKNFNCKRLDALITEMTHFVISLVDSTCDNLDTGLKRLNFNETDPGNEAKFYTKTLKTMRAIKTDIHRLCKHRERWFKQTIETYPMPINEVFPVSVTIDCVVLYAHLFSHFFSLNTLTERMENLSLSVTRFERFYNRNTRRRPRTKKNKEPLSIGTVVSSKLKAAVSAFKEFQKSKVVSEELATCRRLWTTYKRYFFCLNG